jgi:hypothetical protein
MGVEGMRGETESRITEGRRQIVNIVVNANFGMV